MVRCEEKSHTEMVQFFAGGENKHSQKMSWQYES